MGNTLAADAMRTTQAAVSPKLKRLEEHRCCSIERTPRRVHLSASGDAFLEHARELLLAHDRALAAPTRARQRLALGISDHVAGPELPALIARMNCDPQLLDRDQVSPSGDLLQGQRLRISEGRGRRWSSVDALRPRSRSAGSRRRIGSIVPASASGDAPAFRGVRHHDGSPRYRGNPSTEAFVGDGVGQGGCMAGLDVVVWPVSRLLRAVDVGARTLDGPERRACPWCDGRCAAVTSGACAAALAAVQGRGVNRLVWPPGPRF